MTQEGADTNPGRWRVVGYQSGTIVVSDGKQAKTKYGVRPINPHLYIFGPGSDDDTQQVRNRWQVAEDLASLLNGGAPPAWLDDVRRASEVHAVGLDGTDIRATGPFVDQNPPWCSWKEDDRQAAHDRRAQLMDAVFGVRAVSEL